MKLKKNILLDADHILRKSEVVKRLDEPEMDRLKGGGCVVWIFDDGKPPQPPKPSPPPSPPCTGCATSCQTTSTWG